MSTEWERAQCGEGKLTASRNRKLAVTTIRDAGATREEQSLLAKHMAHSVETADRHYDRSSQTADRHRVLDTIQEKYKVSYSIQEFSELQVKKEEI